ncbi:Uncharacterized conserved protein, DUF1015 family [Mariprofundus ferrinatatus]|uniref:Uncharacterized conserved protein, DUF1015 family n=1 Tax=Mariprofundus ferrinatatus TaxID=1921087 RepID=A0A2K8L202_9PROT|nr:DUF1015 family protein [Mariprofundus ferrinatatus]ATX81345.1 Uncharacterized conserved protein, DUF1015 family [Mariprofundus ferrinatatus]
MSLIRPFAGLRPAANFADAVVAPPYDVLSSSEARQQAAGKPWSFLHVSKAEIDLPESTDPFDDSVYAKSKENFGRMLAEGVLVQDDSPLYYVYRLQMGEHVQTGIAAAASVDAYDADRIKKHEFTRPAKEDDRVRQIEALSAQTGPVFLVYRANAVVDGILADVARHAPDMDVRADSGVQHTLWVVRDQKQINTITAVFDEMDALYVADGHHRSAAASRVAAARKAKNPGHNGEEAYNYFLSVIFPHDQMYILDYNRVVTDLNGLDVNALLARVAESFDVEIADDPVHPERAGSFGMYLAGSWYALAIHDELIPQHDPVARLDVSLLADHLIEPLLGISDPRRDSRIDFVGGIRGLSELEKRVDSGEMAVAFSMFPTSMDDLMAVADSGNVMPPKSTWFEPKLADGVVSQLLEARASGD